jgi:hypothetical protein
VNLRPGVRLHSAVDDTEVLVIAAPEGDVQLGCGGQPMLEAGQDAPSGVAMDPAFADGTALGKRFADEASGLELLCTKAGQGTLTLNGAPIPLKVAKALPASD